jgi:hypothetical protein
MKDSPHGLAHYKLSCADGARPFPSCSGLDCWQTCRFRWWLKFVRGIERRGQQQSQPLLMGRAWDSFQELFFSGSSHHATVLSAVMDPFSIAKVSAMCRAFSELFDADALGHAGASPCQSHLTREIGPENARITFHGHVDRDAGNGRFAENKLTGRPEFHFKLRDLRHQLGCYFLLEPRFTEARMEVARPPQLRYKNDEPPEAFEARCLKDILARPAFYFIGYDRKRKTYGRSIFRSEIDLDLLERRILCQCAEVLWALNAAGKRPDLNPAPFAPSTRNCFMGSFPCEYVEICDSLPKDFGEGNLNVSREIYEITKEAFHGV